jgi:hypothetical protein
MARLRIWLRRHVRGLRRTTKSKTRDTDRHKNDTAVTLKNLRISTPIPISNDAVNFKPPPSPPFNFSLPIRKPTSEPFRHSTGNFSIPQPKEIMMEDMHSISAPSTLVEDIEAAPSLCEDSDEDDTMLGHLWPATPTSPTHSRRRMSFLRVLSATPDHHTHPYDPLTSRPQSFDFSSPTSSRRPSATHPHSNRTSHYSMLSQGPKNNKRISVVSQGNKRISTVSQSSGRPSFNNKRRASMMSVSAANNRYSGIGWDESRLSQRFSRRMSWGFETFSTHTEAYVMGRI